MRKYTPQQLAALDRPTVIAQTIDLVIDSVNHANHMMERFGRRLREEVEGDRRGGNRFDQE